MKYNACLQKLYTLNRTHKTKYDLENVKKLAAHYGDPQKGLEIIHITGTNGKGSCSYKIAKTLENNNYKTGLFTSPHISSFRERFQINDALISREFIEEFLNFAFKKKEEVNLEFSFFELLTIMGFKYFAENKVDFVALEVGIGGRLDCTNIIDRNRLAVITSIGLDHCEILGHSIEQITREKCGLIKPNCPVLIGPSVNQDIVKIFCNLNNSRLYPGDYSQMTSFLEINKQICRNAIFAINDFWGMKLQIDEHVIDKNLPGRFEFVDNHLLEKYCAKNQPDFMVLDVGHNPMAINNLCQLMKQKFDKKEAIFVFGTSGLKDSSEMLKELINYKGRIFLIQANSPRSKNIEILKSEAGKLNGNQFSCLFNGNIKKTLRKIFDEVELKNKVVVVCGSFFNMTEVREEIGFEEEKDDLFLNEYSLDFQKTF